ncbi:MAG: LCP family protein [Bacilli bacterium]|nr:LCP family protein [Bacilli bacterium]
MKKNVKNKKVKNIIYKVIASISTLLVILFCFLIYKLNMLPFKYLIILYGFFFVICSLFNFFVFNNKVKSKIKLVVIILFLIIDLILGIGSKYLDDTIDFVGTFGENQEQSEGYYVKVLDKSSSEGINDLSGKVIGVYSSANNMNASSKLSEVISYEIKEYEDIEIMFIELMSESIDAVLVNDSILSLLEGELEHIDVSLKDVYNFSIVIKEVDIVKTVDVSTKKFNIYVAGGDSYGSIKKVTNTDVNMVISVDPVNHKLLLTSIPRDYYVNFPGQGENAYDKLTHAGYYGINESVLTVEKLLDIDINYYIKVNFSTVEGVIDAIGGVDVKVDKAFTASDGTYSYKKGVQHMNGKKALRFARERKAFTSGDIERVKNQQKVLSAIIDKVTSSTALITSYSKILDSVSKNFATNMKSEDISKLVKMQLNDMRGWSITSQNLVGTDLYTGTYTFPKSKLYVMKPKEDSVEKVREKIDKFFE